jgi:sugar/nucleoside kinase (ribokinase family)
MTPVSAAFDWVAVGDVGESRKGGGQPAIGGGAGRLAAHAAGLNASVALVGKVGDDEPGRRLRQALSGLKIDLRWLQTLPSNPTTLWSGSDDATQERRVERGADLALRLDELPPGWLTARMTVVSGYSLSVEPARSAAMGALSGAAARGGISALLLEAELLWSTNSRVTRRILEAALALSESVALSAADARVLFGPVAFRQALRMMAGLGPRTIYLTEEDGSVLVREGSKVYSCPGAGAPPGDRLAGPAAFWVGLAHRVPVQRAALESVRYAASRARSRSARTPTSRAAR